MTKCLPHLHDSHNSGIDLILAILKNSLLRSLLFVVRLLKLDLKQTRIIDLSLRDTLKKTRQKEWHRASYFAVLKHL